MTAIVFGFVGSAFAGCLPGGAGHTFQLGGKPWNWLGEGPFLLRGLGNAPAQSQLALIFEFLAVALAAMLPWGSGADRWRLTAGCAAAAVFSAVIFPLLRPIGLGAEDGWPV